MRVAVIGSSGYVGRAAVEFFRSRYEVVGYDVVDDRCPDPEAVNSCDLAVICVPTPQAEDGSCDTSIVEEVVAWVKSRSILIKSTVPPGTTDRLALKYAKHIAFSPEYIGESSYFTDWGFEREMVKTPFFIFGGPLWLTRQLIDIYLPIAGPSKTYRQTDARTAELVKYMENSYFALKVTFANEMAKIAEKMQLDYHEVRDLWALDPRVDRMHTAVFRESPGFGGKCLPKDLSALIEASKKLDYFPTLLNAVKETNDAIVRSGRKESAGS